MSLPHELIHREATMNPDVLADAKVGAAEGKRGNKYATNPIVHAATPEETVLPLVMYVDGVPYTNNDSVTGFSYIQGCPGVAT